MCVLWSLWHIVAAFSHGEQVQWKPTLKHSKSSVFFIAFHERQSQQISNPPLYLPSPLLVNNWRTSDAAWDVTKQWGVTFLHLFMFSVKDKLWACLRKYDSPKMEHDNHCQRDRLKLLECHCFVTSQIFDQTLIGSDCCKSFRSLCGFFFVQ